MGKYLWAEKIAGVGKGRAGLGLVAVACFFAACSSAEAFKIDVGSDDVTINWDNSIRYNLGYRVGKPDPTVLNDPNLDDGNRNFNTGIIGNRLDLLSEIDFSYQKRYGIRVSGAGWYDQAYDTHIKNTNVGSSNHIVNGQKALGFTNYVDRYYVGPSGELLDAFAFGKFDIGQIPVQVKVGRQTQYWGESLMLNAGLNSIAYAQSPLDIAKGYAVPNTTVKELFRPLNSVSVTVQPTSTLTVMGQYFLQWEPNRYPEAGTYFGIYDTLFNSSQSLVVGPGLDEFVPRGRDIEPRQAKDWGVGMRWSPEWLDGTLGVFYRNFSDKFPQVHVTDDGIIRFAYPSGIDLYGVSLSKQLAGVSVGAEFSYRHNMPLVSEPVFLTSAADIPRSGETAGARGDTLHALVNVLGIITKTPLFDSAQYIAELNWGNWMKTTQGGDVFKGRNGYDLIDRISKNFVALDLNFVPTWFQVLPGADLSMPLFYSRGLTGNSPTGIIQKNAGTWSTGLSLDYLARHKFDLIYVDYFGKYEVDPATGTVTPIGDAALLKDRGTLTFTYRYTF